MAKTLAERIASARTTDRVRVTDLENLIADTKAERARIAELATAASNESVDFTLTEAMRDEAAAKADSRRRTAQALDTAINELSETLAAKRESDAQKACDAAVADVRAKRAALVDRIRTEWPEIVAKAAGLFEAISENDAAMKRLGVYDASAEAEARNCPPLFTHVLRLVDVKLPALEGNGLAWPRPVTATPVVFDYGAAKRAQQAYDAEKRAAAQRTREQHARDHGIYRLSTGLVGPEPCRLPTEIVDAHRLPRGIYSGEPWKGELAHAVADQLRGTPGLNITRLDPDRAAKAASADAMPVPSRSEPFTC